MFAGIDVPAVITLLAEAGPIGVGIVALAEKFFPVVPSYVVFVLLGMTAASGQSDLAVTVAATATGSTLGALGWYGLGLALGPRRTEALIERFGQLHTPEARAVSADGRGLPAQSFRVTVVGQTVPAVRVYLSIPAGVLKLAILNFLGATLIGSMLWSGPLLTLGYVLRERSADAAFSGLLVVTAVVGLEFLGLLALHLARRSSGPR